jgi:hypothetical protein
MHEVAMADAAAQTIIVYEVNVRTPQKDGASHKSGSMAHAGLGTAGAVGQGARQRLHAF